MDLKQQREKYDQLFGETATGARSVIVKENSGLFEYHFNEHKQLHCDAVPAMVNIKGGIKYWYQNGVLHSDNGPAVIANGFQEWIKNGVTHRNGGLPARIWKIKYRMRKEWGLAACYTARFLHHRVNRPAIIGYDWTNSGVKWYREWWVNGEQLVTVRDWVLFFSVGQNLCDGTYIRPKLSRNRAIILILSCGNDLMSDHPELYFR
jgi:hypothetical protein